MKSAGAPCGEPVLAPSPRADLVIADTLSDDDRVELGFRGVLSIDRAVRQLGWKPVYGPVNGVKAENCNSSPPPRGPTVLRFTA